MTEPVYGGDLLIDEEGGIAEAAPKDILAAHRAELDEQLEEAIGQVSNILRHRANLGPEQIRVAAILLTKIQEAKLWSTALI